ncbi:hypothetical protein [Kitasatospora sp. MBT66]|uniref:DUF6197 family protein n=1 Tax=Kitasatospora sp. MBT66 TaxID=1444769 RepID=UPI0011EA65C3|nr:hypothetical protein [Kitasatospora sp. MBT66]
MTLRLLPNVFEKAAEIIEKDGLAKGVYKDADGCHCALGALNAALDNGFVGINDDHGGAAIASEGLAEWITYADHLNTQVPDEYGDVPEWNDEPERTAAEVAAFLRKAGKDLQEDYNSHYYA